MARTRTAALLAALPLALATATGCASGPEPVEGSVRYRDVERLKPADPSAGAPAQAERAGVLVTITTAAEIGGGAGRAVTPAELGALVRDLEEIGLFDLPGRAGVPAELPGGSIAVEAGPRRFFVTRHDLRTPEEGSRYSLAARRIVEATQEGPRYRLGR